MYEGFNITEEDIALLAAHGLRPIAGAEDPEKVEGGESEQPPLYDQPQSLDAILRRILGAMPSQLRAQGIQIDEFHWYDPATGSVWRLETGKDGPMFRELSEGDSKRLIGAVTGGGAGSGGGGGTSQANLDLAWARLNQDDRQFAEQLAYQYMNAGLDANAA